GSVTTLRRGLWAGRRWLWLQRSQRRWVPSPVRWPASIAEACGAAHRRAPAPELLQILLCSVLPTRGYSRVLPNSSHTHLVSGGGVVTRRGPRSKSHRAPVSRLLARTFCRCHHALLWARLPRGRSPIAPSLVWRRVFCNPICLC